MKTETQFMRLCSAVWVGTALLGGAVSIVGEAFFGGTLFGGTIFGGTILRKAGPKQIRWRW